MSYDLFPRKQFRKQLKKLKRSGSELLIVAAEEALQTLKDSDNDTKAQWALLHQWRDHPLKGSMKGARELHVGEDTLLIYRRSREGKLIDLIDITTHEELRRGR